MKIHIVYHLSFFKDNKGSLPKALKAEQKVFAATHTSSMIEAMGRRNYVLLKLKIQKLSATLDVLRYNYDFQSPNTYHELALITQLSNDLKTLRDTLFLMSRI